MYRALADPTRRFLLDELQERDGQSRFELCSRLTIRGVGSSRQAISQHLDVLESAGLVIVRRHGRYRLHHLDTSPLRQIAERWPSPTPPEGTRMPRITLTSVFVDDQAHALDFYTRVLGFVLQYDVPVGDVDRWLTVVSPDDLAGAALLLEPSSHPAVPPFKSALVADGIPALQLAVDDVPAEYERLVAAGVTFVQPPTPMGPVTTAVLDDTCGNLVQLAGGPYAAAEQPTA